MVLPSSGTGAPAPTSMPSSVQRSGIPPLGLAGMLCAVLVVIGSFGAWITVSAGGDSAHANGTARGLDGRWTAALGVAAGILFLVRYFATHPPAERYLFWAAAACFAGAALFGIYTWQDLNRAAEAVDNSIFGLFGLNVSAGWGLILTTIAAAVGAIASFMLAQRSRDLAGG